MLRSMLTTIDNPHDPFTNFKAWFSYDIASGYHTSAYLARIAKVPESLSDADQLLAIEEAIDEIVKENVLGIYKKVTKEFPDV